MEGFRPWDLPGGGMWTWLDRGSGYPRGLRPQFNLPGDGKRMAVLEGPFPGDGCYPAMGMCPRGGLSPGRAPLDIYPWTSLPPGGSPGGHVPGDESLTYPAMGYFTYPAMTPCYPVMTTLPTR